MGNYARPFFMGKIRDIATRLKQINIEDLAGDLIATKLSDEYEDLLRGQLLAGKRGDNSDITPEYRNEAYAEAKPSNPERAKFTPNLDNKGKFHASIFITVNENSGEVLGNASDIKAPMLFDTYDENNTLLNLRPVNKQYIGLKLAQLITNEIKLKL